ncbi:unnamed protein product [Darwinula stevensoni]|uniref:Apple domain-containing protein n=1 Tax=Darwinula stevensoni TaxID=69355 RepID=A0A7R9FPZ7_9CRUS|nr:unnamed protein product [Darwinula stevensoni]CAG0898724.1 unnamed protein product [Darwinula stevensoni]
MRRATGGAKAQTGESRMKEFATLTTGESWQTDFFLGLATCNEEYQNLSNGRGKNGQTRTSSGLVAVGHVIPHASLRAQKKMKKRKRENLQSAKMKRAGRIRWLLLFLLSSKTECGFLKYYATKQGQRYGDVSRRVSTRSMGNCNILCSSLRPKACKAYNYRSSDGSCELVEKDKSSLIPSEGYQAYVQKFCLTEHPMVENADLTYLRWNGKYPAPSGAKVLFHCEEGFTDGKKDHWATCSDSPDSWCTSFVVDGVSCPRLG